MVTMAYISVTKLEKLFFRCHKILPLVYDESLSYYEVLCKVANSVNEVIEATNTLNDNVATLNSNVIAVQQEVEDIANEINSFETSINAKFDELEEEFDIKFETLETSLTRKIDKTIDELNAEVEAFTSQIDTKLQEFEDNITALVNKELELIDIKFASLNVTLKSYIQTELQKILDSIPEITTVWVIDPTTGELGDIQSVVNNIYDLMRYWALTADEFDSLGMNCNELDKIKVNGIPRGLTAYEWDFYAKLYLNKKEQTYGSYLDGTQVTIDVNVDINNSLLKESGCYECSEFDSVGGDVDTIDALNISAYRWDWFSNNDYIAS